MVPTAAGMVAPLRPMVPVPAVAVRVPPQLLVAPERGVAITMPVGKMSVSAVFVAAVVLGLDRVMLRVDMPPVLIVTGLKLLPTVGAPPGGTGGLTVKVATAGAALLPLLVF